MGTKANEGEGGGRARAKRRERLILFWVYGDGEDTPYIIRNPPRNLASLLREWNALDRRNSEGELRDGEEWDYVNAWLKGRGVDIIEPAREVRLDSYQ